MIHRYLLSIYVVFLFGIVAVHAKETANEKSTDLSAFVVKASVSDEAINIDQEIVLQMLLEYPLSYTPNVDLIRRRLLIGGGVYEPPFILVKDIVYPPKQAENIITQQIDFILAPQRSGNHNLTARLVQFNPKDAKGKPVEIASDIFTISVSSPDVHVDLQYLIEPPMDLSLVLPVTLSQRNRLEYLNNTHLIVKDAKEKASFISSRTIPWLSILAVITTLLVITFIRLLPAKAVEQKVALLKKEETEQEIKQELKSMFARAPKDEIETKADIIHFSFLLRLYLLKKYEFPAFSFTAEELAHETQLIEDIPDGVKEGMDRTFQMDARIKFAKYTPTPDDFYRLIKVVEPFFS